MTLLTASMMDKDVDGVVSALAGSASMAGATVVCTSLDLPRAMPAGALAGRWTHGLNAVPLPGNGPRARVMQETDPIAAVQRALAGPGTGPIVVAGSLYLVGAIRSHLIDDPDLRDPDPAEDR